MNARYPAIVSIAAVSTPLLAWFLSEWTDADGMTRVHAFAEPVVGVALIKAEDVGREVTYLVNDQTDGAPVPLEYFAESASWNLTRVGVFPVGERPTDEALDDALRILRADQEAHRLRVEHRRRELGIVPGVIAA